MNEEDIKEDESEADIHAYLSTYQWVTVGQLLEGYGLTLPDNSVLVMLREKSSFYFQLLRIPVMNVLTGIIVDQIKAYRVYIQKMFVEYLVSGHADDEGDMGRDTREALEKARVAMLDLGHVFDETIEARDALIIETQHKLMDWTKTFRLELESICKKCQPQINQNILNLSVLYDLFADAVGFDVQSAAWARHPALTADIQSTLQTHLSALTPLQTTFNQFIGTYEPSVLELQDKLNGIRKQFYVAIGEVQDLLQQFPEFELDELLNMEERAAIQFDSHIGEG